MGRARAESGESRRAGRLSAPLQPKTPAIVESGPCSPGASREGDMQKTVLHRHRAIGVVALLSLSGVGIAACSPASEDAAAPVYLMGTVSPDMFGKVSPVMRHSVASIERTEIAATATPTGEPIALAPSLTASAAAAQPASDVIPLDDPPALAKPAANPP